MVKERVLSWLPRFEVYAYGNRIGSIRRKFSFIRPKYQMDCCGWEVEGDFWEWDYQIKNLVGQAIATVSKKLFHFTATYEIDVSSPAYALNALMIVLAIDAEKCSRRD